MLIGTIEADDPHRGEGQQGEEAKLVTNNPVGTFAGGKTPYTKNTVGLEVHRRLSDLGSSTEKRGGFHTGEGESG